MEPLLIEGTDVLPRISFDPASRTFEISGESRPEDASYFYSPLIKWMENYRSHLLSQNGAVTTANMLLNIKMPYYNSSTSKYLLDLLKIFGQLHNEGHTVEVHWLYESEDIDLKEKGEELSRIVRTPFIITSVD